MTNELITPEAVEAADNEARAAESAALQLAMSAINDDSIEFEAIEHAEKLGKIARLRANRVRAKAEKSEASAIVKARKDLRDEILSDAKANGADMLELVDTIVKASRELVEQANANDRQLDGFARRALALGVPDKGVASEAHAGLGVSASGDILIGDDVRIQALNIKTVFSLLFHSVENGILPRIDAPGIESARARVAAIK